MLKDLAPVTRIDHLARSTFDVFAIVKRTVDISEQFRSRASRGPAPAAAPGAARLPCVARKAEERSRAPNCTRSYNVSMAYDFSLGHKWMGRT